VRSFKRPEEVELFRQVYGKAFTLLSVYASRSWRLQFLKKALAPSLGPHKSRAEDYAVELIGRDYEEEGRNLGQRVGKTFPLADYFVTSESRPEVDRQLKRLVQLTFGNPYVSPTRDEQAMFFARAAALRSLDLSRQVGAAIVSSDGETTSGGVTPMSTSRERSLRTHSVVFNERGFLAGRRCNGLVPN
jgi:deoxycytidylate deaminase